jgi:hypothetical protein
LVVERRVSLRDATGILPGEIRSLSPAGGDLLAFSDTALEMRATIGTAIACDTVAGRGAVSLTPVSRGGTAPYSVFSLTPRPGDVALIFDEGEPDLAIDDAWIPLEIADVSNSASVCAASPLITSANSSAARLQLRFSGSSRLPDNIRPGAFVRLLRRIRYRFYRASSSEWYLGYSEWGGTAFSVVQPVSGPFAPFSTRGTSGLTLRYFDSFGAPITDPADATRISRVDIVVRGASGLGLAGQSLTYRDSQFISVRARNK